MLLQNAAKRSELVPDGLVCGLPAEQPHTVSFPPILGWLLIAGGTGALIFGALSKKD
jgi:hypothetical protein